MKQLLLFFLLFNCSVVLCQSDSLPPVIVDSTKAADTATVLLPQPDDTTAAIDSRVRYPEEPLKPILSHQQQILAYLPQQDVPPIPWLDHAQISSWYEYDPMLFRVSTGPWGEAERVYPLGFEPAALSRTDNLFGDASIAHPLPIPGSEELVRADYTESYHLLSPALSSLFNPFGRPFSLYQILASDDVDSAVTKMHVARGRGGFANTTVTFANDFGPLGDIFVDATFQNHEGIATESGGKLDRMRLFATPQLGRKVHSRLGLFFSRLDLRKFFFPPDYNFVGRLEDNYSGVAAEIQYSPDQNSTLAAKFTARRDDQKFDQSSLESILHHKYYELNLRGNHQKSNHSLQVSADLRYLDLELRGSQYRPFYYNVAAGDIYSPDEDVMISAHLAVTGSSDLDPLASITTTVSYRYSPTSRMTLTAASVAALPQPEMQYFPEITRSMGEEIATYNLRSNAQLQSGRATSVEGFVDLTVDSLTIHLRSGYTHFGALPLWRIYQFDFPYGEYCATRVDRDLYYMQASAKLKLPYRLFASGNYAYRHVTEFGNEATFGPQHIATAFAGGRLLIPKLEVTASGAIGMKYRSLTDRYFVGGSDDSEILFESFVSFDLKRFHFFYNFTNLLNSDYSSNGIGQPGRSHWWGFTWELFN